MIAAMVLLSCASMQWNEGGERRLSLLTVARGDVARGGDDGSVDGAGAAAPAGRGGAGGRAPAAEQPEHRAHVPRGAAEGALLIREIHRRLKKKPEFEGSYAQVKRMARALKKESGPSADDVLIPVITDPGDVVQVDFGYVGKLLDPVSITLRKTWVFVGVLGYSRRMWAKLVFDQRVETWVRLHVEMFEALGGVPHTAVPDNLKAAVIRAAFTANDETSINRSYRELTRHYGFKIDPTPPRDPGKRGKVESGVKYLKNSVLKARTGDDFEDVQRELREFVDEVANQRTHGTTGQPPIERFAAERPRLHPRPPAGAGASAASRGGLGARDPVGRGQDDRQVIQPAQAAREGLRVRRYRAVGQPPRVPPLAQQRGAAHHDGDRRPVPHRGDDRALLGCRHEREEHCHPGGLRAGPGGAQRRRWGLYGDIASATKRAGRDESPTGCNF